MSETRRNSIGPEFIPFCRRPIQLGRSPNADVTFGDPSVAPMHAVLCWLNDQACIRDHGTAYGTFVNGVRTTNRILTTGDHVQFGTNLRYQVAADGLLRIMESGGNGVTARGLTLKKSGTLLVDRLDFAIAPNSFVGILGPSGIGKSTILHSLAGYLRPASGELLDEYGYALHSDGDGHKSSVGYVPQDDVVVPLLTARENLAFAARLRFAAAPLDADIDDTVWTALLRMGLQESADKRVLSGGQRKRLSVAIELLKRPRLLLLDEPTSGLDPALELVLMQLLRSLANEGVTVVCTTHNVTNVRMFDQVIAIGRSTAASPACGRLAFGGPPDAILGQLRADNWTDVFRKLDTGEFVPIPAATNCFASGEQKVALDRARQTSTTEGTHVPLSIENIGIKARAAVEEVTGELFAMATDVPLRLQTLLLTKRALLQVVRDRPLMLSLGVQPVALSLLAVLSQFRPSMELSVLFFTAVIAIWLGMNNSVRDFVRDRRQYLRDRLAGMQPFAYFLARILSNATIGCLQVSLLLITVRLVGGLFLEQDTMSSLNASFLIWGWYFGVLMLSHLGGIGLGLLVSSHVNSEETALAALPMLIMPQLLLSAVASGYFLQDYDSERAFKPIATMVTDGQGYSSYTEGLVESLSLLCLSRPATLLCATTRSGIWMGDGCHLVILLCGTWAAAYASFLRREQEWPRLVGLS